MCATLAMKVGNGSLHGILILSSNKKYAQNAIFKSVKNVLKLLKAHMRQMKSFYPTICFWGWFPIKHVNRYKYIFDHCILLTVECKIGLLGHSKDRI